MAEDPLQAHTGAVVPLPATPSPYTLSSSDNPGALISPILLNGENYIEWSKEMMNALKAKRKIGFINGTIKQPSIDDPDFDNWQTVNSMLVGWIRAAIEPKVKSTVTFIEEAHLLWSELKQRFSVGNNVRIHQLKTQLAACRQNGQSVLLYYGQLCTLWEELQTHEPLPACSCGAASEISKRRNDERVHQFVMGLDDSRFGGLCTNLLGTDPLPSLGEIYSKVVREEDRLKSSRGNDQQHEAVGFVTRLTNTHQTREDDRLSILKTRDRSVLCAHCGRSGHDKKECWQLVGFPDWWVERSERSGGRGNNGRGRGNGRGIGRGQGQPIVANATSSTSSSIPGFSQEQWKILTQMIQDKSARDNSDKLSGKAEFGEVILDTGASHHMTGNLSLLTNVVPISPCSVGFADGSKTLALNMGVFPLSDKVSLPNVLYVPSLNCTLISVSKLVNQTKCFATFTDTLCFLQDRFSRTLIGTGEERDGVYYLTSVAPAKVHRVDVLVDQALWHQRLGHPSSSVLSALPFNTSPSVRSRSCDVCFRAKQTRDIFPVSINKTTECFSLIHCDVWGPYKVPSSCGAVYFLTIVDDFSRAVWTYLMLEKSEVRGILTNFLVYAEKQFGKTVKTVRSDNGTEFMCLSKYFREHGILHQTSCVATPQQNGRVERKHRHILNVSRALLFQAHLPVKFWGEAVLTAAHLINRTPTAIHNGKSPYEILHGCKPDYSQLKVFGSACYAHRQTRNKDKFSERSRSCIFVGYPFGKKGWKVFDLERDEFLVSRDVVFCEDKFPYRDNPSSSVPLCPVTELDDDWLVPEQSVARGSLEVVRSVPADPPVARGSLDVVPLVPQVVETTAVYEPRVDVPPVADVAPVPRDSPTTSATPVRDSVRTPSPTLGKGLRQRFSSVRLSDYVTYNTISTPVTHHALLNPSNQTSSSVQGNSFYPLQDYISDEQFSPAHRVYLAAITKAVEPKHFKEAVRVEVWNNAMGKEVGALEDHKTWDIVTLPPNKVAIGSQWVYKIKYNADGTIERYKARLVVQGNNQVEGDDYNETFAPVVKLTTVRTLLRLVAAKNWDVFQMDVNNAFLHGDLEEEVYMKLPPGFRHQHPGKVCRLRKSLYGLKQAPRCWFKKLSDALTRFGFVQSYDDYSLFSYTRKGLELRVLIYVDDLIICGNNGYMIQKFKDYLSRCFSMKDLGKLKYFLGIEVSRGSDGIFLSQRKYALDIILDSGQLGARPALTPLEHNHHLATDDGPLLADPKPYRRLIGRLIYLTHTRPELNYSVHVLSQFMQLPREAHMEAALRVVRFLKGSPGQGILLKSDGDLSLTVYCDSDWASCPLTRRSISAFVVMLGGSPISWKTKKQKTVSHSSAEAEYRAMVAALREIKWLRRLLQGLGIEQTAPTRLFCDSKAAIHIAANPVFHERTKHIESDCHSVRDAVRDRLISTHHIGTKEQLADLLTKALGRVHFEDLLSKLGVRNLHTPT